MAFVRKGLPPLAPGLVLSNMKCVSTFSFEQVKVYQSERL